MGQVLSLPKRERNLLCFSLAEEEIKTEQEVVEGMDISTRSKGESKSCIIYSRAEEEIGISFSCCCGAVECGCVSQGCDTPPIWRCGTFDG